VVGDIFQRGAAQASSWREEGDRLEAIGLAGAVGADEGYHVATRLQSRRAIVAEMREVEAMNARGGHTSWGRGLIFPLPLWERVAPHEVRRRVRGSHGSASFAKISSNTDVRRWSTSLFQ